MTISLSARATLLSSTALVLWAGAAAAADLPSTAPPPPPPSPLAPVSVISWTGFYVGANAGWVGLNGKATDIDGFFGPDGESAKLDPSGGIVGGQLGYNQQFGSLVAGVEGDYDFADAHGTKTVWPDAASFSAGLDSLMTIRLRLGFLPTDNLLLYVTGGYAGGHIKDTVIDSTPVVVRSSSWHDGWTIGGGGEWALNNQWSIKAEALYVSFGDRTVTIGGTTGAPFFNSSYRFKFQNSAVVARAGLNFHF